MLKLLIILGSIIPILGYGQVDFSSQVISKNVDTYLKDQFKYFDRWLDYYSETILDSIDTAYSNLLEQRELEKEKITLFEKLTGIKAHILNIYAMSKVLNREIVDSWKLWVNKNRELLTWDFTQDRINRTDKDIYLTSGVHD